MSNKIDVIRIEDGKMYDFVLSVMGREEVLLTKKELMDLYDSITNLMVDDESLWEK